MPELPEIESLRQKLAPKLKNAVLSKLVFRRADLRAPLPKDAPKRLCDKRITSITRRSKYLLINFENAPTLVVHLGMSGRFFFAPKQLPLDAHDHVLIDFKDGRHMRLRDPRRFGMLFLCDPAKQAAHPRFKDLGPEPLEAEFSGSYLLSCCKRAQTPIKSLLMNAHRVVGVGNIYASEALFLSGIRPTRMAARVTAAEADTLCANIKRVLTRSIAAGGTSFRDYVDAEQKPGLYAVNLNVYGRAGRPCPRCATTIKRVTQTGRSSFYCPACQK